MTATRLIVIGNGMVGQRFLEELVERTWPGEYAITVFGAEPRPAYDRVHLSSYFAHHTDEDLALAKPDFYARHGIRLCLGEAVKRIDREQRLVETNLGTVLAYDKLVLATGATPWVPPIAGSAHPACFVYRTIDDLKAIEARARLAKSGAVIGGGLLGLEAAGALKALGLATHVVEYAPVLMAEQLDRMGGEMLRRKIDALGVQVHTAKDTREIVSHGQGHRLRFADGSELTVDLLVFSTGIRPQDTLARYGGLPVAERGGIVIDDHCQTADPDIYAIGECAAWHGQFFGLVAPGYKMAQVAADHLMGCDNAFVGADMSAKLKLLGVSVGSIGDAHGRTPGAHSYVYQDDHAGVYKKLVVSADGGTLLGAVLVGDVEDYGNLLQMKLNALPMPEHPDTLILPAYAGERPASGIAALPGSAVICSCFDVSRDRIAAAVADGCRSVEEIKAATHAGTGCGGCVPLIAQVLNLELSRQGIEVSHRLCEHFTHSRQALFHLIKVNRVTTFDEAIRRFGQGYGCEVCKPTVASILASAWNDYALRPDLAVLQDSNDAYLGNLQKDGSYSVIPRMSGGEVTPQGLMALAQVASDFQLYTKVTGAQRIGLFGAHKGDLPRIWARLIDAGFESGQAYAKALRMVKTCVGSTWCRYGVQDSVGFGVELEHRYKGLRTPHKLKFGISGCTRECAEAQGKDVGIIATDAGWNLYVGGNGGMKPRHAELLAADLDRDTLLRYLDRFIMLYAQSADKLQRTASWVESLDGGIGYLRSTIVDDALGLGAQLEADLAQCSAAYRCEWQRTLEDPAHPARFADFINSSAADPGLQYVAVRGQHRPATPAERRTIVIHPLED
ncbi:nitrite reductase large subunit NirB [Paludibacterium purpuratum]|uniref:Assimilatory nitrite reductase (NAD(P)H) large subunit n=1 Tax=Paludibacterium purpuratum TaxID=1144873 RepID=A0A4R7B7F6_9NEIS|nr:nitrite reductase large subunit NirB [Paludibacterium purpuratum]TDR79695.1 assimilatory nitrite reductase (NAD(P)H) large subunit precursor [Paludibacterium purpuratum]